MAEYAMDAFGRGAGAIQAIKLNNLKLQEVMRERQALALMLSGIQSQGQGAPAPPAQMSPAAPPPMPGGGPQPQMQPPSGSLPLGPGGAPAYATPTGAPPPPAPTPLTVPGSAAGAGSPTPPQPGGTPMQGTGGGDQMMMRVRTAAQRIKQMNPNAPDDLVMRAAMGLTDMWAKGEQFELRLAITQLQQQGANQRTLENIAGRLQGIERQQEGAGERAQLGAQTRIEITGMQQAGADRRTGQRIEAQNQWRESANRLRQEQIDVQKTMRMPPAIQAKLNGAKVKWQGALRKLNTLISSAPGDAKGIAAAQEEVDKAEREYQSIALDAGGGTQEAPSPAAAPPPSPAPAPTPAPAASGSSVSAPIAPLTPKPGEVQDGYRFKGGNPADPGAWEKVQ